MKKITWGNLPKELETGIRQITEFFKIDVCPDGMIVNAQRGEENSLKVHGGVCEIVYQDKVYFFRALGHALEKEEDFSLCETPKIKHTGVQLDLSRNGAMTVSAIKEYLTSLALMGMDKLYLYMEDMFEVPGREYFGYLRGAYTKTELKEIDDFGFHFGIEVIPSIQTLGHHKQYLKYEEANDIKDTDSELLVGAEETYQFIENMLVSLKETFRTNQIILGMDEAHTLGFGNYLLKHGYQEKQKIFLEHLNRVFAMTDKLGLNGMIYSDMFFRMGSETNYYYDKAVEITPDVVKQIPPNATLIYWHYGEEYGCDDWMLEQHNKMERELIAFGGAWTCSGHLPETDYALECTQMLLKSCEKYNVDEVVISIWGDNGNECSQCYSLLTVQYAAEYAYGNEINYEQRFEFVTGGNAEAYRDMSAYQNIFDKGIVYQRFSERFQGKTLFWQDIMLGVADDCLKQRPMSEHYGQYAEKFSEYGKEESQHQEHYAYAEAVLRVLQYKCYIAERLWDAYQEKNTGVLEEIFGILDGELFAWVDHCYALHKKLWFRYCKPFGWETMDVRYGGLKARMITAKERIRMYLDGEIEQIEELEEKRLPYRYNAYIRYHQLASPSSEF